VSREGPEPERRRRVDPERRERIARAALEVIAERGVEALTHRAVAAAANVPLGSTTYHFADREELLLAALEQALATDREMLEEWARGLPPEPDLPRELADLIVASTQVERTKAVVGFEIFAAAVRHPDLRPSADVWANLLPGILTPYLDEVTALALSVAVEALLLRGLLEASPRDRDAVEAILRRVLA